MLFQNLYFSIIFILWEKQNLSDSRGMTALHACALTDAADTAWVLFRRRAKMMPLDQRGKNFVQYAVVNGKYKVADFLGQHYKRSAE